MLRKKDLSFSEIYVIIFLVRESTQLFTNIENRKKGFLN